MNLFERIAKLVSNSVWERGPEEVSGRCFQLTKQLLDGKRRPIVNNNSVNVIMFLLQDVLTINQNLKLNKKSKTN